MEFVVSTQVLDARSHSRLSCWAEAHPVLWRELTSTQASIWGSRHQLIPTFCPNKWMILEVDHQGPPLPHNPNGRLVRARSMSGTAAPFCCLSLRCNCICRPSELELTSAGLFISRWAPTIWTPS